MLSGREVYLIIRARDEATRAIRGLAGAMRGLDEDAARAAQAHFAHGQALTSLALGIGAIGAAGLIFFGHAIDAAADYNQAVGKTLTQTDDVKTSMQELADMGREVAKEIPAPFEQMQEALYDIFSSMDVNIPEAKQLLTEFAKAAVAGQTDMQTAGRATIAVLNAYHKPASAVNEVNDVMFQLVRKGVGTYQEFAESIGQAIPASVRAGQSFETLAGMMAFLTRNGLDASMAATSAARSLELMADPEVANHLHAIGVEVRDAKGEFRPMVDVLGEMNEKFKTMTAPERAQALQDLFKGQGYSIQARRFFDMVFKNFDEFEQRVGEMGDASGAMDEAYAIMFEQPQSQVQLLKNKFDVFMTTLGEALIPTVLKLVDIGQAVMDFFNNLSPAVKRDIAIIGSLVSIGLVLLAMITGLVGMFMMLQGAAIMMGTSIAVMGGIALGVVAALAALVVVGILIYKNWDKVKAFLIATWDAIKSTGQNLADWFQNTFGQGIQIAADRIKDSWNNLVLIFKGIWDKIISPQVISFLASLRLGWVYFVDAVSDAWTSVKPTFDGIEQGATRVTTSIGRFVSDVIDFITNLAIQISTNVAPVISQLGDAIQSGLKTAGDIIAGVITFVMNLGRAFVENVIPPLMQFIGIIVSNVVPILQTFWDVLVSNIIPAVVAFAQTVWSQILRVLPYIAPIIAEIVDAVKSFANALATNIIPWIIKFVKYIADAVLPILKFLIQGFIRFAGFVIPIILKVAGIIMHVFGDVLVGAFKALAKIIGGVINIIKGVVNILIGLFTGDWKQAMWGLVQVFQGAWDIIVGLLQGAWDIIGGIFNGARDLILGIVGGFVSGIIDFFVGLWDDLVGHSIIPDMINAIIKWFWELPGQVLEIIGTFVANVVQWFLDLALNGAQAALDLVTGFVGWVATLPGKAWDALKDLAAKLAARAAEGWTAFKNKASELWGTIVGWIATLATSAWTALKDLASKLSSRASEAWTAFKTKASEIWTTIWNWITTLPGAAYDALRDLTSKMVMRGSEAFNGMKTAIFNVWTTLSGWLAGLGSRMAGAVGSLTRTLWQAGWNLLNGLWNGMKDIWDDITGWLGGLGSKIMDLKGPPKKDAVLLEENGKLIMMGLERGMRKQWKSVEGFLTQASNDIQFDMGDYVGRRYYGNGSYAGAYTQSPQPATASQAPTQGKIVEVNIHTQELVPEIVAAQTGYLVARRLNL